MWRLLDTAWYLTAAILIEDSPYPANSTTTTSEWSEVRRLHPLDFECALRDERRNVPCYVTAFDHANEE